MLTVVTEASFFGEFGLYLAMRHTSAVMHGF